MVQDFLHPHGRVVLIVAVGRLKIPLSLKGCYVVGEVRNTNKISGISGRGI